VIVVCQDQRTPEWHAARLGKLTGSVAADMLATVKTKGAEAAARRDLRLRLVCERLTGASAESDFVSKDMQRGIDLEPVARAAYEAATGAIVKPVGFVAHDELEAGCSPDGLVRGGIVEIKCPKPAIHLGYIRGRALPADYRAQVTHNLWITGAGFCDFVSYNDRFPPPLHLFRVRVPREAVDLAAYELAARLFLDEVARELDDVRGLLEAAA
jgi:hypothetical protein